MLLSNIISLSSHSLETLISIALGSFLFKVLKSISNEELFSLMIALNFFSFLWGEYPHDFLKKHIANSLLILDQFLNSNFISSWLITKYLFSLLFFLFRLDLINETVILIKIKSYKKSISSSFIFKLLLNPSKTSQADIKGFLLPMIA